MDKHYKLKLAEKLKKRSEDLIREVDAERKIAQKDLHAKYYWKVKTISIYDGKGYDKEIPVGAEVISFIGELTNEKEYQNSLNYYGTIMGSWQKTLHSVNYYRNYGMLFHSGGGYCFLRDKQPCNDKQWENLKNGIFGDFLRD